MLAVDTVVDGEAVIDTDDRHLHFVASVATTQLAVWCTSSPSCGSRAGAAAYFVPVRFLHDPVTRAMMQRASRRLGHQTR